MHFMLNTQLLFCAQPCFTNELLCYEVPSSFFPCTGKSSHPFIDWTLTATGAQEKNPIDIEALFTV